VSTHLGVQWVYTFDLGKSVGNLCYKIIEAKNVSWSQETGPSNMHLLKIREWVTGLLFLGAHMEERCHGK